MNRRKFLNIAMPATGGILLAPGMMDINALAEVNRQFTGASDFDTYDVIINGAGFSGYFAALKAAESGKKVLLVEKRPTPGFEITAKKKLWMKSKGVDKWDKEMFQLFFPPGESDEIHNPSDQGPNNSLFGDELLLFNGSVRKGMLRNLLVKKVHVMLMTDVCGLLGGGNEVTGVLLAGKHGLHQVNCRNFIDASENLLFSRHLLQNDYRIQKAGYVLELLKAKQPAKKEVDVPESLGVDGNRLYLHPGKHVGDQLLLEFRFATTSQNIEDVEHQARELTMVIGAELQSLDPILSEAKIEELASEASLYIEGEMPHPDLAGHYLLSHDYTDLSCEAILAIQKESENLVNNLRYSQKPKKAAFFNIAGQKVPIGQLSLTPIEEPGLAVPLKECKFALDTHIATRHQCQVLVAGGGTAGAMVAMGASQKGANTIVADYFHDLGGTKTVGGVMGYYHGVKDSKYFIQQEEEASQIAFQTNTSKKTGRKLYHLQSLLEANGRFLPGAIMCGTLVKDQTVEGILICRNGKLELVQAQVTVDATGDGDIAFFAGAAYWHGNSRTGKTQNYSQWDIRGGATKTPSNTNRDYDIIDNRKISELQRGLFLSHYKAHFYDFHPMLTVRESRRVKGVYTLDLIDAIEGTHFEDMVSLASSDFDPHHVGSSEFTRCGFLLPHSNDITLEIPYRSLVPESLDGLLLSGKAFSQTQNAIQFTRMSGDLAVLGYFTGQIASEIAWKNVRPRDFDLTPLQKEWSELGYIPRPYANKKVGSALDDEDEISRRVDNLAKGDDEFLEKCTRLPRKAALKTLESKFEATQDPKGKLLLAKAMAWFGNSQGNELIIDELRELYEEEKRQGYPDGFVDTYDDIRGREKNILEGLYWKINQNIALLAMSGDNLSNPIIKEILENSESGGDMMERENEYFNGRIDLKLVPFFNRILNLCFYAERVPDPAFIPGFERLLQDENIKGYKTTAYEEVRWRVYGGELELSIAAAMARCGSRKGYELLAEYLDDVHFNFKQFASAELATLTGKHLGYDPGSWKNYLSGLSFPQKSKPLALDLEY